MTSENGEYWEGKGGSCGREISVGTDCRHSDKGRGEGGRGAHRPRGRLRSGEATLTTKAYANLPRHTAVRSLHAGGGGTRTHDESKHLEEHSEDSHGGDLAQLVAEAKESSGFS